MPSLSYLSVFSQNSIFILSCVSELYRHSRVIVRGLTSATVCVLPSISNGLLCLLVCLYTPRQAIFRHTLEAFSETADRIHLNNRSEINFLIDPEIEIF
jgi:hypothetical protein